MKKRILLLFAVVISLSTSVIAEKSLYIPWEWKNSGDSLLYKENDPDNKYTWSKTRSKESENFVVYWDKYYGNTLPTNAPSQYRVDLDDLLQKAEEFYKLNVETLKFANLSVSKLSKYKMMIVLNHSTDWICYGGGYDFEVGALWLSPNTCWPVGQSVAHEIGHSFQYMCYSDYKGETGFHSAIGMGSTFWEQTAQWQSVQSYPELMFSQSIGVYKNSHNLAFTHEWQRYQSYWFHYYLAEKYGIDIIGRIWRHQVNKAYDPNQVYMDLMGYDANQLYKEYFDYAMKMTTWDLDVCRNMGKEFIGIHTYNYVPLGNNRFQVAYSSCPQATGYNVIPLNVPAPGTIISTSFTALKATIAKLADSDPAQYLDGNSVYANSGRTTYNANSSFVQRGFRLGYVALLKDGTRVYSAKDTVYCTGTAIDTTDIEFIVPDNTDRMWFVVSPAPKKYVVHKWDDLYDNDDQWPYQVEFKNTGIYGCADISDEREICDVTLTYDLYAPRRSDYTGTNVQLSGIASAALGTAFQMQPGTIAGKMMQYNSSGPTDGKIMFYAVSSKDVLVKSGSTANGYGHWYNSYGNVTNYGNNSYVYSEFDPNSLTFTIGQMPNTCVNGNTYTIRQALRYKKGDKEALAKFVFNLHIDSSRSEVELSSVEGNVPGGIYDDISPVMPDCEHSVVDVYSVTGVLLKSQVNSHVALDNLAKGIYIVNGKKVMK